MVQMIQHRHLHFHLPQWHCKHSGRRRLLQLYWDSLVVHINYIEGKKISTWLGEGYPTVFSPSLSVISTVWVYVAPMLTWLLVTAVMVTRKSWGPSHMSSSVVRTSMHNVTGILVPLEKVTSKGLGSRKSNPSSEVSGNILIVYCDQCGLLIISHLQSCQCSPERQWSRDQCHWWIHCY